VVVSTDGRPLAGRLHAPPGEPSLLVVLCHGLAGRQDDFAELPERLVERGAVVLTFDYSGHGASPGPPGLVTAASHLADTCAAIAHLQPITKDRALVVAGHSFGAHAALRVAAELPSSVRAVAVISAPRHSGDALPGARRVAMRVAGHALRRMGRCAPPLRVPYGDDGAGRSRLDLRTLAYAVTVDNVAAARAVAPAQSALVVRGVLDPDVDEHAAAAIAAALATSRTTRLDLPHAGHSPFTGVDARAIADAIVAVAA
jgi:pimeloyl-ACP methyl ester carboxylesterase